MSMNEPGKETLFSGSLGPVSAALIISFVAIALYNILELTVIIFTTFRRKRGLYFISFCVATWSIPFNAAAVFIKYLRNPGSSPLATFLAFLSLVSWSGIVTGQSLVLYSRLHLVDGSRARLHAVLTMIIIDAVCLHGAGAFFIFTYFGPRRERFAAAYAIYEKVQISVFFAQETIISSLYIAATVWMFRSYNEGIGGTQTLLVGRRPWRVLRDLVGVNVVIILLDATILGLQFAGFYDLQTVWKLLVYSVKLKLEFRILNSLIDVAQGSTLAGPSSTARDYFAGVYNHCDRDSGVGISAQWAEGVSPSSCGRAGDFPRQHDRGGAR